MKVKKKYEKTEVLDAAKIGFEFEFYCAGDILKTAKDISKYIKKRVVVPFTLNSFNEPKPLYHSPVKVTSDIFKIEPDQSGGADMRELITGPIPYKEARNVFIKILDWISDNGYTNERCSVHLNISIDENKIPTKFNTQNINIPKFILSFDETKVYDEFPNRKNSVYARSIKEMRPNNILFYTPSLEEFSRSTLTLPVKEKYYGVNFLKAEKGYLEYRYIGGKDYEKKSKKILDLADYFILHMYDTLNFEGFTEKEKTSFKKMMNLDKKIYESFVRYENFVKEYPDIKVSVDMNEDPPVIESMWTSIRDKLFSAITTGNIKKGFFNYDKEIGRYQLKDTKLTNCNLQEIEFVKCNVEGVIMDSWFFECEVKNSRISNSVFEKNNVVDSSKITFCELHINNKLDNCYIDSFNKIINCEVNSGVIRSGQIGKLAKVSKETNIVEEYKPISNKKSKEKK